MLMICPYCLVIKDIGPAGSFCLACANTGHLYAMKDEASLQRGIEIYERSNLDRVIIERVKAKKLEAIRLLAEANENGLAGGAT